MLWFGGKSISNLGIADLIPQFIIFSEKVMMTEETVYDDVIECHHSYDSKCHTTYKTIYDPQQVWKCQIWVKFGLGFWGFVELSKLMIIKREN